MTHRLYPVAASIFFLLAGTAAFGQAPAPAAAATPPAVQPASPAAAADEKSTPVSASAHAEIELLGFATIPGDSHDLSGLTGEAAPGIPNDRLGSMGSGIAFLGEKDGKADYVMVNDRGPNDGATPFVCRFHRFSIGIDPGAKPPVTVKLEATTILRHQDGTEFVGNSDQLGMAHEPESDIKTTRRFDPEAIRVLPNKNLLISDEYGPYIYEFNMEGKFVRPWPMPESFMVQRRAAKEADELPPANMSGRQANRGAEGLAVTRKGVAWVLLQSPLIQDGALNAENKRVGRNIRFLRLGSEPDSKAQRQNVYRLESGKHGVSEVLAVSEQKFLVLERDGSDAKFRKIYMIDFYNATDVTPMSNLSSDDLDITIKPVKKELFIDMSDPKWGITKMPEKIEGLCFGPKLKDGRATLIVTSDNDLKGEQPTYIWAFAIPAEALR